MSTNPDTKNTATESKGYALLNFLYRFSLALIKAAFKAAFQLGIMAAIAFMVFNWVIAPAMTYVQENHAKSLESANKSIAAREEAINDNAKVYGLQIESILTKTGMEPQELDFETMAPHLRHEDGTTVADSGRDRKYHYKFTYTPVSDKFCLEVEASLTAPTRRGGGYFAHYGQCESHWTANVESPAPRTPKANEIAPEILNVGNKLVYTEGDIAIKKNGDWTATYRLKTGDPALKELTVTTKAGTQLVALKDGKGVFEEEGESSKGMKVDAGITSLLIPEK